MKKVLLAALVVGIVFFSGMARASSWVIDTAQSSLSFEAVQMGAPFEGRFGSFNGTILFDPEKLGESRAEIVIDMSSVDAGSADRNRYLPMPDWFDVKKWPEARFVTTGFEKGLDRDAYVARGTLMIRDKTVPITLPFTLTIEGNRAEMRGETSLNRLDAGVGQGQWSDTKSVGAEVKIRIHVVAVR